MKLAASVQMSATHSSSTTIGHNDDLVDDLDELGEVLPATPSASTTPSGTNNGPVDDLARVLSVLLLAPSSASIPLGVVKDYLLPCLATDAYCICKLAVVHPVSTAS
jgi:hypothetical protein